MKLSVIIVNYNVKYFLEQCLYSVQNACRNIEAEIIVVDNNSSDGSTVFLLPKFPRVNFILNTSNEGFAKANNRAASIAKGSYVLFLNPDTIVGEDSFEKCINFFMDHKEAGALGVHMVDGAGKFLKESKRAFPSPLTSLFKLTGMANLFPRSGYFARYYLGHLPENENHEVDVLAGAFLMIPQSVLSKTGGFDEMFFMYGEDVDLSYRVQKAGYKNFYFAETSILHFKGESSGKGSLNYVRIFYKAMSLFVKKHYSGSRAGVFTFFIQLAIWARALITVVGNFLQQTAILLSSWFMKRATPKNEGVKEQLKTIVVSNKEGFSFIAGLLQKSGGQETLVGRAGINATDTDCAIGNIENLSNLLKEYKAKEIIFCEGGLSFKEIITIIQSLPEGTGNKFHAAGSCSIVGSSNRNRSGNYIADNPN